MFVSSFAFFLIRLSVEFRFQKSIFIFALIGVILKFSGTYLYIINIRNLILLNILVVSQISISGVFLLMVNQSNQKTKKHECITIER